MKTIVNIVCFVLLISTNSLMAQTAPTMKPVETPTPPPAPPAVPSAPLVLPTPPLPPSPPKKGTDTTRFNIGHKQITILDNDMDDDDKDDVMDRQTSKYHTGRHHKQQIDPHWTGVELGFNNFVSSGFSSKLPVGYDFLDVKAGRSIDVSINFFEKGINIYQKRLYAVTGLGVEWNNFKFSKNMSLVPSSDSVRSTPNNNYYNVNKLTIAMVNLPLLLEYNTHPKEGDNFHITAGLIVGYAWDIYTKEDFKANIGAPQQVVYQHDSFGISPFRYSATVRMGLGAFTVYANYGLNALFQNAPEIHPFSIGLAFTGN